MNDKLVAEIEERRVRELRRPEHICDSELVYLLQRARDALPVWVPVSKKLPESGERVLFECYWETPDKDAFCFPAVVEKKTRICAGYYEPKLEGHLGGNGFVIDPPPNYMQRVDPDVQITRWMPLPPSDKGDG